MRQQLLSVKQELTNGTDTIKDSFSSKRQEIRQQLDQIREKQKGIDMEKQKILEKIKEASQAREKSIETVQTMKAKMPYKTTDEVERAIKDLEKQVEARASSLLEEKRLLNEISNLKKIKRSVLDFKDKLEELDKGKQASSDLRKDLKVLDDQAKILKTEADRFVQDLNVIKKQQEQEYKQFSDKFQKRKGILQALDVEHEKLHKLIGEIRKKSEDYMKKVREERTKRMESHRAKKEKFDEEHRLAELERVKELRLIPPFIEEILKCNALLLYLAPFGKMMSSTNSSTSSPSLETTTTTTKVSDESLTTIEGVEKILKKKSNRDTEEDSVYSILGGGKKKEKKSKKPSSKNETLRHPLSVMDEFLKISVNPPATTSDVPRAINELQSKRDHFQSEQKRIMEERSLSPDETFMDLNEEEDISKVEEEVIVASVDDALAIIEKELNEVCLKDGTPMTTTTPHPNE